MRRGMGLATTRRKSLPSGAIVQPPAVARRGPQRRSDARSTTARPAREYHLHRHKRYPSGESAAGRARGAFSIDRSGRVLSARLAGSSGNPSFDEEAVAMVRRASPVPPPPPEVAGGTITFTVPVLFSLR